jgi:hypothetical protein
VADFLLAQKITITCRSYILRLGQLFQATGGSARFALYTDTGGASSVPGTLVAATGAVAVSATTEATSSLYLADPGTYWVVTNISSQAASMRLTPTPGSARYVSYAFANPAFPPSFPGGSMSIPNTYNLYAVVRRNPP